jgi:hypothetical protein
VGNGIPSATITAPVQFPLPLASNALPDSPISRTVPLSPGVVLQNLAALPPAPSTLGVYQLQTQQYAARDLLDAFGLLPRVIKQQSGGAIVGLVSIGNRYYWSSFQLTAAGYSLQMTLVSALAGQSTPPPQFDAGSAARTFLVAHQLCNGLQPGGLVTWPDGSTQVTFNEFATYQITGAYARVTFSPAGVLTAVDLQWVDTSVSTLAPGISAASALEQIADGLGLVWIDGAIPTASASVTGVTILYAPVTEDGIIYYEPVYQFSGTTPTGGQFRVYVPALDPAYLR